MISREKEEKDDGEKSCRVEVKSRKGSRDLRISKVDATVYLQNRTGTELTHCCFSSHAMCTLSPFGQVREEKDEQTDKLSAVSYALDLVQ